MEIRPILSTLRRHKTAATLIVLEIAIACAIICNALFIVFERLDAIGTPSGIVEQELVQIRVSGIGQQANAEAITREDLAALRAIPGVTEATIANQIPFGRRSSNSGVSLSPDQARSTLNAAQYTDRGELVETLGLRFVAGRDFQEDEHIDPAEADAALEQGGSSALRTTAIVSQAMAEALFPGESAVGKVFYLGPVPLTIVGVVETLARPNRQSNGNVSYSFILPLRYSYADGAYLIRVADPSRRGEVASAAVSTLEQVASNRLIRTPEHYVDVRADYFANDRAMIGMLLLVCGLLLVVTALGIVGLASFWVQQRTRQIGVRRALGATRGQILRYFQMENFLLATLGIALGMLLAYGLNQLLMTRYELPRLPLTYLPAGAVVLWLVGQVAAYGPARRAARVPPAVATRSA